MQIIKQFFSFILAYYSAILLHEWGHSFAAWFFHVKNNPFTIYYGGWTLWNIDEAVNYNQLLSTGQQRAAAIIGISGVLVSTLLVIICLIILNLENIKKHSHFFIFFYWVLAISLISVLQYFTRTTFSTQGDIGRFTHGLTISPWWIFIPGTLFVIGILWRIFTREIPKAYDVIPVRTLWGRRAFLFATIFIIFFFISLHGYNPLTDKGTIGAGKIAAFLFLFLPFLLLFLCDPSRVWVKKRVSR